MREPDRLSDAQIEELLKPLDAAVIRQRKSDEQDILPHEYVRARLSEIFGPLGWSEQTLELTQVFAGPNDMAVTRHPGDAASTRYVAYRARVRVIIHNPDGSTRAFWDGAGAWGQGRSMRNDSNRIWDLHSDCMNGALSVAFLRATKSLGNQFGLCLYSKEEDRERFQVRHYLPYPPPEEEDALYIPDQRPAMADNSSRED
jgi:hypothetical protein